MMQKKKFLQAIGGWKKIRAQKNCPTPPQISNGPSLIKIVKSTGWEFQMLIYKKQSSKWYKFLKI
jgi:hypothetical protein